MSYDIYLLDPVTKETIEFDVNHDIKGGTYIIGGTNEAWLNITYNYGKYYRQVFGEEGIRTIYNKSGAESIPLIKNAISQLGDEVSDNYWDATEGNTKRPLYKLLSFAQLRPDGIWDGD